jgi:hypothetical protein
MLNGTVPDSAQAMRCYKAPERTSHQPAKNDYESDFTPANYLLRLTLFASISNAVLAEQSMHEATRLSIMRCARIIGTAKSGFYPRRALLGLMSL